MPLRGRGRGVIAESFVLFYRAWTSTMQSMGTSRAVLWKGSERPIGALASDAEKTEKET